MNYECDKTPWEFMSKNPDIGMNEVPEEKYARLNSWRFQASKSIFQTLLQEKIRVNGFNNFDGDILYSQAVAMAEGLIEELEKTEGEP